MRDLNGKRVQRKVIPLPVEPRAACCYHEHRQGVIKGVYYTLLAVLVGGVFIRMLVAIQRGW